MKTFLALICIAFLSFSVACDPPEDDGEQTEESEEGEENGEQEQADEDEVEASEPVELGELGVRIVLPEGTEAGSLIGSDTGVMIQGAGIAASVDVPSTATKTDLEEATERFLDMHSAENLESEELDDGWILWFTNEGGAGTNYWVESFRTIGDAEITCGTMASQESQQKSIIELCKSIHE